MKNFKIQYILILLIALTGCSDYVEIDPETTERELIYTEDYRMLIDNYLEFQAGWSMPLLSSDDAYFSPSDLDKINIYSQYWKTGYAWNDYYYDVDSQDTDWSSLYKVIYNCNTVIDGVMDSPNGTETEKESILSLAKVNRASAYLMLVNMYAPHYNVATADSDKSVPLLLTSNLYTPLYRASVATVYNQIVLDLNEALPFLMEKAEFNVYPSKCAAYALLARTYLYMGDYNKALLNAENALSIKSELNDLNDYDFPYQFPVKKNNPEIILSKEASFQFSGVPFSEELLNLLTPNDLRKTLFIGMSIYSNPRYVVPNYENINNGPSVPEVMLIKAECQARLDNANGAIATLNTLRAKRFDNTTNSSINLGTGENALDYVLNERRIELMGRGYRWFDMKRLSLESGREIELTRTFNSGSFIDQNKFSRETSVYPIYADYIKLNPELAE